MSVILTLQSLCSPCHLPVANCPHLYPSQEETFHTRPTIRILLPDRLKSILVDDWENVTKSLQLVRLPSRTPVSVILDDYSAHELSKRRAGSPDADILAEVIAGLREYFNKCLGRLLLYRFEREQYFEVYQAIEGNSTVKGSGGGRGRGGGGDLGGSGIFKAPEKTDGEAGEAGEESNDDGGEALASLSGKRIEDVYGGEHLLRLFGTFLYWIDFVDNFFLSLFVLIGSVDSSCFFNPLP